MVLLTFEIALKETGSPASLNDGLGSENFLFQINHGQSEKRENMHRPKPEESEPE
jgi:hypothetical protein